MAKAGLVAVMFKVSLFFWFIDRRLANNGGE